MARKWSLFFHRVFTVLSNSNLDQSIRFRVARRFRRVVYILLGFLSLLGCLLATPGLARNPIATTINISNSDQTSIAQTPPTSISDAATAEQFEQTAREKYAAGQFQAAAIAFQQAAQRYEAQGNLLRQALNLSNLSLSNQQLGLWTDAADAITKSLSLLQTQLQQQNSPDRQSAYAQALDIAAKLELVRGRAAEAIATWERSAAMHTQLGHPDQAIESQINQSEALQHLGLYNRAVIVLQTALKTPEQSTLLLAKENITAENQTGELTTDELTKRLQKLSASANTIAALQSLGDALEIVGNLEQADTILQHSLTMAQTLAMPDAIASINLSLGNITRAEAIADLQVKNLGIKQAVVQLQMLPTLSPVQQVLQYRQIETAKKFDAQTKTALAYYQQAADSSSPAIIQVQADLNRLNLLLDKQQETEAEAIITQINPLINRLPPTQTAINARINFAQSLRRIAGQENSPFRSAAQRSAQRLQAAQLLTTAQQQAIALADPQTESYALGSLGQLYEDTRQWTEAAELTKQALEKVNAVSVTNLPQNIQDADLAYRWQYQLGRIRVGQDDRAGAIAAYKEAATILNKRLSLDVTSSNLSYQSAFDENAQQPVHKAWMDLLLKSETPSQDDLKQVREISTSLLETQLNSFLQEPCAVISPTEVDKIVEKTKTAIFYTVILPDRLEVIVKLPGTSDLQRYQHPISSEQLLETLSNLQIALEEGYTFTAVKDLSKQLYDWIVAPVSSQLTAKQIDTLVFTLDRRMQSIPMAALYDGEKYLIEKYAVSEILGLKFDGSDRSLPPEELKVIGAGLSIATTVKTAGGEDVKGLFPPLSYVKDEMGIIDGLEIQTKILLDQEFTLANFNTQLNEQKFPVVHLATHGQFSFDPKRTFLLTADPTPFDVDELAGLFRVRGRIKLDAIELLIITACETAAGDNLATLGIAGAAVRAGARSAIASLWTLDDAINVEFTKTLYANLQKPDISKAEAVRQAQLIFLQDPQYAQYKHPRYWSPYILAGNWLPLTTSRSVGSADSRV